MGVRDRPAGVCSEPKIAAKIDDYGIIGDCRSTALISRYGSIDWLCWPRFDSASIFAAILDPNKGGHWSICPKESFEVQRAYIRDSNVLQTEFITSTGRATLTDLMPVASEDFKRSVLWPDHELIRELCCTAGEIDLNVEFFPRIDYGKNAVTIRELNSWGLRMDVGRGAYWLRSSSPMKVANDQASASAVIHLKAGETYQFSLSYARESPAVIPKLGERFNKTIQRSIEWWQKWSEQSNYKGPYRDVVTRSALALKLLTYAPSGAIIAAATTSLPERIGDSLNWDYRFCWLRDASLTIRAMLGLGYVAEAESFITWLLHTTQLTQPRLRVMYTVYGQRTPAEVELASLSGYCNSPPVRIGNDARQQSQMDIYGEVIDAAAQYAEHIPSFDKKTQKVIDGFGKYVAQNWDQPDEGIWEPRSGRQKHTYSRLMCWAVLDRILVLYEKGKLEGTPPDGFAAERDKIRKQIETRAWSEKLQSYLALIDEEAIDATLLRLAWAGFEHADSARMKGTYERIRQTLRAGDHLLYRYQREPQEGAFGICGFWEVEHLALGGGTLDEAHAAFQQLLTYQNDLGLFAEEIDPTSGEALGNFPQAFTHVGLISAALTIAEQERGKAQPAIKIGSDVKASKQEARQ